MKSVTCITYRRHGNKRGNSYRLFLLTIQQVVRLILHYERDGGPTNDLKFLHLIVIFSRV